MQMCVCAQVMHIAMWNMGISSIPKWLLSLACRSVMYEKRLKKHTHTHTVPTHTHALFLHHWSLIITNNITKCQCKQIIAHGCMHRDAMFMGHLKPIKNKRTRLWCSLGVHMFVFTWTLITEVPIAIPMRPIAILLFLRRKNSHFSMVLDTSQTIYSSMAAPPSWVISCKGQHECHPSKPKMTATPPEAKANIPSYFASILSAPNRTVATSGLAAGPSDKKFEVGQRFSSQELRTWTNRLTSYNIAQNTTLYTVY